MARISGAEQAWKILMVITEQWLRDRDACEPGIEAFVERFPDGCDMLELLAVLSRESQDLGYGGWLLQKISRTPDRLELDDYSGESLFFPGDVVARRIETRGVINILGDLTVQESVSGRNVLAERITAPEVRCQAFVCCRELNSGSFGRGDLVRYKTPSSGGLLQYVPRNSVYLPS